VVEKAESRKQKAECRRQKAETRRQISERIIIDLIQNIKKTNGS
jgi:hypothetical protein